MGYIIKKTDPLVNIKLTDVGREKLSLGQLQFTHFALSDGEMIYTNDNPELLNILRPVDNQPRASYLIPSEGSNYIVPIDSIVSYPQMVHSTATERGFFTGSTGYVFDYMLCGAYAIPLENFQSGTTIDMEYVSGTTVDTTAINPSGLTPSIGDLILIKTPGTRYTGAISSTVVDDDPIPYLWYEIKGITGNTTTGFTVEVDRELPDFNLTGVTTGATGFAYFYKGGDMINDIFDEEYPYAYWSAGLLDFTDTCSNGSHDVPIWNMHVIYATDIIGLTTLYRGHSEAVSNNYRGLNTYLKYAANDAYQNKFGVIHYTNNTVNNYYGEGFYSNTLELRLPTLMWHKKQFGGPGLAGTIGYTFVCDDELKYIDAIAYYDLIDAETIPTTVGKVFPDLQIIVIENEELITAMSLKSNRNWSLPKPVLTDIDPGTCAGSSSAGIITSEEELHVTYALIDSTHGITGVHCEDFATVGTTKAYADVKFRFPYDSTDPLYNEFGYIKRRSDGIGFSADDIWIILQKTGKGELPNPNSWYYFNANAYLGENGCIPVAMPTSNEYELFNEAVVVSNIAQTIYPLAYQPIGDVIVSVNGYVLKEAADLNHIYFDSGDTLCGDYVQLGDKISFALSTGTTATEFAVNDVIQFHYLIGTTIGASTVKLDALIPSPIPTSGTSVYVVGSDVYMDLPTTPAGTVYVFYNGLVISGSMYSVVTGGTYNYRVLFSWTPQTGSWVTVLYLDSTGSGSTFYYTEIQPTDLNNLKVILNDQTFPMLATTLYDITDIISLPLKSETGVTFGDETFFFGNVATDIKATIYKSVINAIVLPNRFIKSANPTFNENIHKVAFTEIDIYDGNSNVVAVGKFSQPLQRRSNGEVQIINAVIDF